LAFLSVGGTIEELLPLVPSALSKGDPFAYILKSAINKRKDAAQSVGKMAKGRIPNKQEALEARNRSVADEWLRNEGAKP
jgi:hypothetical protein